MKKASLFNRLAYASLLTCAAMGCSDWQRGSGKNNAFHFRKDSGVEEPFSKVWEIVEDLREDNALQEVATIDCLVDPIDVTDNVFIPLSGFVRVDRIFPGSDQFDRHTVITIYQGQHDGDTHVTLLKKEKGDGTIAEAIVVSKGEEMGAHFDVWNISENCVTHGHNGWYGKNLMPQEHPVYER